MKILRKILLFGLLPLFVVAGGFILYFFLTFKKVDYSTPLNKNNYSNSKLRADSIMIDFNGDGVKEVLNVTEKETGFVNIELFDLEGNKIAGLSDDWLLYNTNLFKIVKLNEKSTKEYLQWNMVPGPHQIETVFLSVIGDRIEPILSIDFEKETVYSPFYNSRGELLVGDIDKDGSIEVIEFVDEYPVNAPRLDDPEVDNLIREQFGDLGVGSEAESMTEIVKRENYGKGRGKKVIMAIHRFVDDEIPYFRRLPPDEYEVIAGKLISAIEGIMKESADMTKPEGWETDGFMRYNDLEQDSKDFNEFVRKFWTHSKPYEFPINDESAD